MSSIFRYLAIGVIAGIVLGFLFPLILSIGFMVLAAVGAIAIVRKLFPKRTKEKLVEDILPARPLRTRATDFSQLRQPGEH